MSKLTDLAAALVAHGIILAMRLTRNEIKLVERVADNVYTEGDSPCE